MRSSDPGRKRGSGKRGIWGNRHRPGKKAATSPHSHFRWLSLKGESAEKGDTITKDDNFTPPDVCKKGACLAASEEIKGLHCCRSMGPVPREGGAAIWLSKTAKGGRRERGGRNAKSKHVF